MTHRPIDVAVNPNNKAQRYILWTNGRIDAVGGAPTIVGPGWYDQVLTLAAALHITNWTTGAGYVLSIYGEFVSVGGAPDLMTGSQVVGDTTRKVVPGVPYSAAWQYIDWQWDPAGTGQGYVLDRWGALYPFGGATTPNGGGGARFNDPIALRLRMQWTPSKLGLVLTVHGGLFGEFGLAGTLSNPGNRTEPALDWARDFFVTDWSTNPPKGYTLDLHAETHGWGGAQLGSNAGTGMWLNSGAASVLHVLSTADPVRIWQVWWGGQQFEYTWTGPPTVRAGAGTNEVQRVAITGSPTGGTFTLSFGGQTTATITHNATAATVQTRLQALSTIGSGNVTVTGGPGPGTPYVVTFVGALDMTDVAQMTAAHTFTGGTSPAVTVTTTVSGIGSLPAKTVTTTTRPQLAWAYSDPQADSQLSWQLLVFTQAFVDSHSMSNPLAWTADAVVAQEGNQRSTRGTVVPIDLPNGGYRFYVRARDTAEQWSAWSNRGWTQSVTPPATPTGLTATANQSGYSVALSVSATTGGNASLMRFEYTDDGTTWASVPGADAVPLTATTTATDRTAPLGKTRTYRATAYSTSPRTASAPSATAAASLTELTYVITALDDPALGGKLRVQEPVDWSRPVSGGVFQGLGADYPTVVKSGGKPRGARSTVQIFTEDAAAWATVAALALSRSTLIYRDPYGSVRFCELIGDWSQELLPGAATRHLFTTALPLVEVAPPKAAT